MDKSERYYLVGLNMIPALTPHRKRILRDYSSSPAEIWHLSLQRLATIAGITEVAPQIIAERRTISIDREFEQAAQMEIKIVTILDPDYPQLLREINDPPPVLYIKGQYTKEDAIAIGIVGTRRASQYGRMVATKLAKDIAQLGLTVVSGMAMGIDTAAHRGALQSGGRTIAVLGAGLLKIYPAINRHLSEKISQSGALISEFPLHCQSSKWTFPQRNRIISGLARGIVVVEAPLRSGALITARFAAEQGREVFAVPGNITNIGSTGPNRLIKDGAKLIETVADIIDEFPDLKHLLTPTTADKNLAQVSLSPQESVIYKLLGLEPLHIDDIINRGDLSRAEISQALLTLQINGLVKEIDGKRYTRSL
ncbi:DNA-processing protein DprA [Candidatus Acetothermia bacterium]|nr:DNA-processing protein DprA [Candidatus Acetothermia bacterium]